jgi:hypothetical protein
MRVKKNFGGKRQGYKGWDTAKKWGKIGASQLGWCAIAPTECMNMLGAIVGMPTMKKGGRVRGVGKATRGYGRAMRKK